LQIIKEKKEAYLKYSNENSLKIEQKVLWNCKTRD